MSLDIYGLRIEKYCNRLPSPNSRYILLRELKWTHSKLPLERWNQDTALKFFRDLEPTHKRSSIITKARRLHSYFNWELKHGYRTDNPVDLTALPKNTDQRLPHALTKREVDRLFKVIPKNTWLGLRDRLAISLMLIHGFRISTIVGMEWDDIEYRDNNIYLHTSSKGGKLQTRRMRDDVSTLIKKYESKCQRLK